MYVNRDSQDTSMCMYVCAHAHIHRHILGHRSSDQVSCVDLHTQGHRLAHLSTGSEQQSEVLNEDTQEETPIHTQVPKDSSST